MKLIQNHPSMTLHIELFHDGQRFPATTNMMRVRMWQKRQGAASNSSWYSVFVVVVHV